MTTSKPLRRRLWAVALLGGLMAPLAGCSGKPHTDASSFVGRWRSSRSTVPIVLRENGEWEIKRDDGPPLQYGVWRYENQRIVWTFKVDDHVSHEANAVLSVSANEFRLREADQTTSVFTRLP